MMAGGQGGGGKGAGDRRLIGCGMIWLHILVRINSLAVAMPRIAHVISGMLRLQASVSYPHADCSYLQLGVSLNTHQPLAAVDTYPTLCPWFTFLDTPGDAYSHLSSPLTSLVSFLARQLAFSETGDAMPLL